MSGKTIAGITFLNQGKVIQNQGRLSETKTIAEKHFVVVFFCCGKGCRGLLLKFERKVMGVVFEKRWILRDDLGDFRGGDSTERISYRRTKMRAKTAF